MQTLREEFGRLVRDEVGNVAEREHALLDPLTASLELLYQLGQAHLDLGDPSAALGVFEQLRQRSPASYAAYEGLAASWLAAGRLPAALVAAKTAVVYGGGRPATALLGRVLLAGGQPREAQLWLERAAQPDPERREDLVRLLYHRPEISPPLEEALPRLMPDAEIALVRRDLQRAMAAAVRG